MSRNMEEYDAFEARITEQYPKMFSQPFGGFAIGEGWWPIIESLCSNIQHYLDWINKNHDAHPVVEQVVVAQIKEKFGGLRFYYSGGDDEISGMVSMAEAWAGNTCETCGAPGSMRHGGWIKTLCEQHEAERQERKKQYDAE